MKILEEIFNVFALVVYSLTSDTMLIISSMGLAFAFVVIYNMFVCP